MVRVGDIIIYHRVDGGDEFGIDAVTPLLFRILTASRVNRPKTAATRARGMDGKELNIRPRDLVRVVPAIRPGEPTHGRLSRVAVEAVLAARESDIFNGSFAAMQEWIRDMIHDPTYRLAVAREAGF